MSISVEEVKHIAKLARLNFSDEELVLDEILSCDPDDMTPRQALDLVARWKKSLSGR